MLQPHKAEREEPNTWYSNTFCQKQALLPSFAPSCYLDLKADWLSLNDCVTDGWFVEVSVCEEDFKDMLLGFDL